MAALESTVRFACAKSLLQSWVPTATTVRWRTRKPNIQRPIPDHYKKARFLSAVEPIYVEPLVKMPKYKVKQDVQEEEYIYERLLAEKVLKEFSSSQAIYIFHENSYKEDEKMKMKSLLFGNKIKMVFGSKKIVTKALLGSVYEPVLQLHVGTTCYVCAQDEDVGKMLKLSKKLPPLIMLGGFVHGRLLTKSQLAWVCNLPDIHTLRAELCSILSSSQSNLSQSLTHHQQSLSQSLSEFVRLGSETAKSDS